MVFWYRKSLAPEATMTHNDWTFSGTRRAGRPPKGPVVKAAMPQPLVALLDDITRRMTGFTAEHRDRTQAGLRLTTTEGKTWSRADVVTAIVAAGAPQFSRNVLG